MLSSILYLSLKICLPLTFYYIPDKNTYFNIGYTTVDNIVYLQICKFDAYKRIHFNSDTP